MLRTIVVAAVAVALAVFAMQNPMPVTLHFLVWRLEQVSLALVILVSFGAGLVIAGVPLWVRLRMARSRAREVGPSSPAPPPEAPREDGPLGPA